MTLLDEKVNAMFAFINMKPVPGLTFNVKKAKKKKKQDVVKSA